MTWLSNFLIGLITPIVEKLISNSIISARVSSLEAQQTALIKAIGILQSAKTPQEIQDAIKAIAAADNSGA